MGLVLHYDIVFFLSKYIVFIVPVLGPRTKCQPIMKGVVNKINDLYTLCMSYLFSIIRKKELCFTLSLFVDKVSSISND
jgi:hypothetical protein